MIFLKMDENCNLSCQTKPNSRDIGEYWTEQHKISKTTKLIPQGRTGGKGHE